jgi:hypothetical protein
MTMILKRPIDSRRLRSLPPSGFGWIDHRFLRDGYFQRCSPAALALYSLLVCVGDAQGLSFYSEPRLSELLGLRPGELPRVRNELIEAQLVAFKKPLYQVLALDCEGRTPGASCRSRAAGNREITSRPVAATPPPPPPPSAGMERPSMSLHPAPAGLDLCAMVKASLKGGAQ